MADAMVTLEPIDSAEVTILVDNALDILAAVRAPASRPKLAWDWSERDQLRAEHGYSLLVTVEVAGRRETLLYDAGLGKDTVAHNMDVLGINPKDIRTGVISHGHADHHGGWQGLAKRLGHSSMPLILHPDALLDRKVVFPDGTEIHMPAPNHNALDREGWTVVEERTPTLLFENVVLVTGQVSRTTEFEKGFPFQKVRAGEAWEADTWIWDDQAVVLNVRGLGLVVLSSCSHAGIVNVVRYAQQLTGIPEVHAIVGGLHLTGGIFEQIIPQTVDALVRFAPKLIVPGHCTGWTAMQQVAAALPDAFMPSNLGTTFRFAAPLPG